MIVARYREEITEQMLDAARHTAKTKELEVAEVVWVPGAFEIPLALKKILHDNAIDGAVCLAAVVKGDTDHDQIVAHNAARKIMDLGIEYQKPVGMGISGPNQTLANAQERAVPYGKHAVETVAEMLEWLSKRD
ncbi:MAG: 6,7-dimethyl-8-ribityllumazine synthase [Candidatus Diapherotrites archaeon]|nr:6,7-dimethyl-8-ribityllumazine synthase [Candidatus Diapherotrites archaeon]